MDGRRFDSFARKLGTRTDRRTVLRGSLAAGAAVVAARAGGTVAAPMDKVSICHLDKEAGTYELISISGNAHGAHLEHGDFEPYACDDGLSCAECPVTSVALFNCGVGYICPTGATTFEPGGPLDPYSSDQAKAACEACFGTGLCVLLAGEFGSFDCAGGAWSGDYIAAFGFQNSHCDDFGLYPDPVPDGGRVFRFSSSYPENDFGYWGHQTCPEGANLRSFSQVDGDRPPTTVQP